jgi:Na+:H+ antiporter, NhaC family
VPQRVERIPRPPTLVDALAPVVVLILLIALTIVSFGLEATDGPLQVALMLSAAFASLVALKNGYSTAAIADAAIGGVTRPWARSSSCCPSGR